MSENLVEKYLNYTGGYHFSSLTQAPTCSNFEWLFQKVRL